MELSLLLDGHKLTIESGFVAQRSSGAVIVRYGNTTVLVTANANFDSKEKKSFLPLTVDVLEKYYASGKIPGGFNKRESKPSTTATIAARLIDRSIRSSFPKDFFCDVHVVVSILSYDGSIDPTCLGVIGASAALMISDIPFNGPISAMSLGYDGEFSISYSKDLSLLISYSDHVVMVEAAASEVSEAIILEGIEYSKHLLKPIADLQIAFAKAIGKEKHVFEHKALDLSAFEQEIRAIYSFDIEDKANFIEKKVKASTTEEIDSHSLRDVVKKIARENILKGKRIDDRKLDQIREIDIKLDYLPVVHGSALFTRGQTQVLGVTTLGSVDDQQIIDELDVEYRKAFFLHYNFPAYSVGEASFCRASGRRELGHGDLAERSLASLMPTENFPYTVRVVSEVLCSNGSSSMASVCAASLSLMAAGVPIPRHVAGVALGLVAGDDSFEVLTDISAFEDSIGDMDLKVAGTERGITAIQMDIKSFGIKREAIVEALEKAKVAREYILEKMNKAISQTRLEMAKNVPKYSKMKIALDKISKLIGPGGKNIKSIISQTSAKIDISDDGEIEIFSPDSESMNKAVSLIKSCVKELEVGDYFEGRVKDVLGSGAFIELAKGKDGFLHVSQITGSRIEDINDYVKKGDLFKVKIVEIDEKGRVRLENTAITKGN